MAKGFKHGAGGTVNLGGGGVELNFEVVGNPQPETAADNTLWVDTDTPISGWIFSAEEPENPEPGLVWFLTATYSNAKFNALKKDSIMVYPMLTKQYVSDSWVDKTTKQKQGDEWVEWWNGMLFDYGDITHVTGGWTTFETPMNVTVNEDGSWFIRATKHNVINTHVTVNSFDLTPYKSLCFVGTLKTGFQYLGIIRKSDTTHSGPTDTLANYSAISTGTPENPIKIDVSLINEECRFVFGSYSATLGEFDLKQMWLE